MATDPCPYCRHHLNGYVIQNVEKDLYPVEYILMGWQEMGMAEHLDGITTPADKLKYVVDTRTLRLFIWKLHNAVNASIERSEVWYKQVDSVNTNRYWPNLYGELHRGGLHSGAVSASRLSRTLNVVDSAVKLNLVRGSLGAGVTAEQVEGLLKAAKPRIEELDEAVLASGFLEETYGYSGQVDDAPPDPDYADKAEAFMRDVHYTLA